MNSLRCVWQKQNGMWVLQDNVVMLYKENPEMYNMVSGRLLQYSL